jgi:hypothetical protein
MEIPNTEILRYLGYRGLAANERVFALIEELTALLTANLVPKSVYGIWDCRIDPAAVMLGDLLIPSQSLANHLSGCRHAVLLAATLGTEADTLIRRYSILDMGKALIMQAVCTVMIETYCDRIKNELAQSYETGGFCSTSSFSPGYGDFDIVYQKDIINLLNCDRRIGLTLTDGYMLAPSKSITSVIGFWEEKERAGPGINYLSGEKCGHCDAEQCGFREVI